ncbi:MAG: alpha-glucan family phosphorylase [Candidatus Marinimicrobia bacterium]|nr:alpha-glucan family phosphorylase [Candidatus Neomarinimicrobiota bacterium]
MYKIAYFSAEIGISSKLPTYSGGLGVLAGDHIKAAADASVPLCAVTLLYKEGYFKQRIDEEGNQTETYPRFDPDPIMQQLPVEFSLPLQGRVVNIRAWQYIHRGLTGHEIPIFLLDTDVESNRPEDRIITLRLYSGDKNHRILQEAILGFGGIRLLQALNINNIESYHMNEGHCSFLTLELLRKYKGNQDEVRKRCVFTTHTPVPAGHDHFAMERCKNLLDGLIPDNLELPSLVQNSRMHMTELGLYFSRAANGVSKLHGSVARDQFPDFAINHITNGVYHNYWVGKPFRELFDRVFPRWRLNPEELLRIDEIPDEDILEARRSLKNFLLGYANSQTQKALSENILTLGFARRAASYKRARLIFRDLDRLVEIGQGKIQIIFAGKAHPKDDLGKDILKDIVGNANRLFGTVKVVFLENYNMWLGRIITAGVDVWLNTPVRPHEASGTSGMKATLNGIPNLSVLDGWWDEACQDGVNGWAIGSRSETDDEKDADHLYSILEHQVIPTYYNDQDRWLKLIRAAIKTGVRFTAHRMMRDYENQLYK